MNKISKIFDWIFDNWYLVFSLVWWLFAIVGVICNIDNTYTVGYVICSIVFGCTHVVLKEMKGVYDIKVDLTGSVEEIVKNYLNNKYKYYDDEEDLK